MAKKPPHRIEESDHDESEDEQPQSMNSLPDEEVVSQPTTKPLPQVTLPKRLGSLRPIGSCFYHQNLQAVYTCSRCGRSICRTCSKPRGADMVFCLECDAKFPSPTTQSALPVQRAVMGFVFSLVAGALIFVNSLLVKFYQGQLEQLFPWLSSFDPLFLMFLGVICGILVLFGAIITYYPTIEVMGASLVLIFSLLSVLIGGGFIVGVVSGVVGGALAISKK